jgi:dedicator of cytokinesis protein 6/7/8
VYPQDVNFSHYPSSSSARNIAIQVSLLAVDYGPDHSIGLERVYNNMGGPKFVTSLYTHTNYHEPHSHFCSEIKIALPLVLTSRHHLLFSFYHIVSNKKKIDKGKYEVGSFPLSATRIYLSLAN